MTNSNACVVIVNNILREYIDDFPHYLSQGFEKLSEILPNIIPTIKNCNIDWNNQQNKIDISDEETNTILHILIQPTYKDLKDTIKVLTDKENIKERYIVYIGSHGAGYSSNWLLEDGIFSANSMLTTLSETSWIENNSMESSSINILTPGNSAHWNKILSTLKIKETKQDRVRVFSFSSEIKVGEESAFNKDIEEFCQTLYKNYQPILLNDDIINSSQNFGNLQLMNKNGSFYVFDEGCGQSSLLALNGFNLLIDGGYKRAPEFWNFLQKLEKIDTYMMTSWNETNLFGMESLLDFKSKFAENNGDLSRPNLNYCVLPIGPNPSKEIEKLEIKSHLEINIEMESQRILHQIKSLEIPLLQMSRDAKSMLSPHQLYFKLGQGCLDAFPLWPCSAETSGDSKRYVDEWQKESKLQTIYFDELVKDNASAFLLIWNGSKVTVESPTEEANMLTRILISSSCHESNLFKSLEEFSKVNPICNSFSGKPTEKKTVEKNSITTDLNKKSTVPIKESPKSMTDKANAAKKLSNDKNKEIIKGDVQNKLAEKKLQPIADKTAKLKSIDKKDEKKDDIVASKLNDEKVKHIDKKVPSTKATSATQPIKKLNEKIVDVSDSKKSVKKSSPTDKVLETNEAKKPIKKSLANDKTPEIDDTKKNLKKPLATEKVTEAGDGKKPLKKSTVGDKLAESVDTKKSTKKTVVSEKSTDSAEVKKLVKKPLLNEKPIETQDSKKPKKTLLSEKGSEADAKKPIKKTTPIEKTTETADIKKTEKKLAKDDTVDQKKSPKRPISEKITEKPVVNKKSTVSKSEIESKKVKDSKSMPQHKTAKKADAKCSDIKKDKNIADVTVIKNDVESDLEKIEVVGQPSISLNTDDTLNNIDTSELLGKMEMIGPNSNHVEDEQLLITAERYDLQSTPLSDMITDSPEHPKTEEDVEALKTDALSIDQDLLINNEEFPEDEKVTVSVNDEFIECEIKTHEEIEHTNISDEIPVVGEINNSDSKYLQPEFILESQNLKDYGIYEDGEYDDEHKIEAGEKFLEVHEDKSENFEFVKELEIEPHESKESLELESRQDEETKLSLDLHSEKEKEIEKINDFNYFQDNLINDNDDKDQEDLTTDIKSEMLVDENQEINFHSNNNYATIVDKSQNNHIDGVENEFKPHLYEYDIVNQNNYENKQEIEEEIHKEISFEKETHLEDNLNTDNDKIDKNIGEISQNFGNDVQEDKSISEIEEYGRKQTNIDVDLDINNQELVIDDNQCFVEENVIDKSVKMYFEKENFSQFDALKETHVPENEVENISDNRENHNEFDNRIENLNAEEFVSDKLDNKFDSEEIHDEEYDIKKHEKSEICENAENFSAKNEDKTYDSENEQKFENAENFENKFEIKTESDKNILGEYDSEEPEPQNSENFEYNYNDKEFSSDVNIHDFEVEKIYDPEETIFQTTEDIEYTYHEKDVIDETHFPEKENGENQDSKEEHERQISEDIKDYHEKDETRNHEEKIPEKEIEANQDSEEERKPLTSEDTENAYHEKDEIDEAYILEKEIEVNEDSVEEREPQTSKDIENAYHDGVEIDDTHIFEKEIEANQDSEENEPQTSEDIKDEYHEKGEIDEPHILEKEIEVNQDSEEEREPQTSEDIKDEYHEKGEIDETHILEKEIEANQDSEEEREPPTSDDIENPYHEKGEIDETHILEKEIEANQDSEEEREPPTSEDIENPYHEKDEIDEAYILEKEIEVNEDSVEEREPQTSEDIKDDYHEKDEIDETRNHEEEIPYKEIEENQYSEEEPEPQTLDDVENAFHENDIIDETHIPEKEVEENQDFVEECEPQTLEDFEDVYDKKNVIDETRNYGEIPDKDIEKNQYSEEHESQTSDDIDNASYTKDVIDETHIPVKEIEGNQDSEKECETQASEEIEDHDKNIIDENNVSEEIEEQQKKQSAYEMENQSENIHVLDSYGETHVYEDMDTIKESQIELDQKKLNDYNFELYPESTNEHKEVFENVSEINLRKDENEHHPYQDEMLQESMNIEAAYKSKDIDDEENDDGEMIIHDVASIGEMDHINESDENEDVSENQQQSENTSEVENNPNQEYLDELENENEYKHNSNEDVEEKNNDPDNFQKDFDVSKENINLNYYEENNTQEINDNNEFIPPEKSHIDDEENDFSERTNAGHQYITERPDSLFMDNYPINEDLIHVQGDSASSENHQETDRIMPDSESNDSDLSVDIVKDHTADSSKDSEQETYVPPKPLLDDIIEDASPSSSLLHEVSEFDRPELEQPMYNLNEIDDFQENMTDVNITPDILRGLKHLNLSEPTEVEVEQIIEDVEIINYQTNIHDSDHISESGITDQFPKVSVEISNRESKESDESVHIPSPSDNFNDDRINISCKPDHDNLNGSMNGNHHYDHFPESDSNHATNWGEPLGLPMPTLLNSKPSTKPASEKNTSHPPTKLKSANATSAKLNGTSSNTVPAVTHKTADSSKSVSSPRNSIPPKPSAPKSAPISKAPASKSTKKPEIIDSSKCSAFYMEIAYIPVDHDGNVNPSRVSEAFFTRVRARQYILPGLEHSSEVLDMILTARSKWSEEDNEIEVRLTPIKMTETLKKWAGQHAQQLSQLNIKIGAAVEHCSVSLGVDNNMPCIAHRIDF